MDEENLLHPSRIWTPLAILYYNRALFSYDYNNRTEQEFLVFGKNVMPLCVNFFLTTNSTDFRRNAPTREIIAVVV